MLGTSDEDVQVEQRNMQLNSRPALPKDVAQVELPTNSRTVLEKRYLRKGEDGRPIETVEEMFWRVAYHVAEAENEWSGDVEIHSTQFYDLLATKRFFPNSPKIQLSSKFLRISK